MSPRFDAAFLAVGQEVETRSTARYTGRTAHVCFGRVERLTRAQVIVRNEHDNESRYWRRTGLAVGYADHHLCNVT